MAQVTIEAARAAREHSERVRAKCVERRLAVHANADAARARRERATARAEARDRRRLELVAPSPWSALDWRRDDTALAKTLVVVD